MSCDRASLSTVDSDAVDRHVVKKRGEHDTVSCSPPDRHVWKDGKSQSADPLEHGTNQHEEKVDGAVVPSTTVFGISIVA